MQTTALKVTVKIGVTARISYAMFKRAQIEQDRRSANPHFATTLPEPFDQIGSNRQIDREESRFRRLDLFS
jgi:hypothetical protein